MNKICELNEVEISFVSGGHVDSSRESSETKSGSIISRINENSGYIAATFVGAAVMFATILVRSYCCCGLKRINRIEALQDKLCKSADNEMNAIFEVVEVF